MTKGVPNISFVLVLVGFKLFKSQHQELSKRLLDCLIAGGVEARESIWLWGCLNCLVVPGQLVVAAEVTIAEGWHQLYWQRGRWIARVLYISVLRPTCPTVCYLSVHKWFCRYAEPPNYINRSNKVSFLAWRDHIITWYSRLCHGWNERSFFACARTSNVIYFVLFV